MSWVLNLDAGVTAGADSEHDGCTIRDIRPSVDQATPCLRVVMDAWDNNSQG